MKKIVIDPVTRIEGHLRIEVEIDENNVIQDAFASGQLFRGIELILKERDPRDAGLLAARICGVCTNSHYRASISSVEDAYNIEIPENAEVIRDLVALSLFIQDHVVHFYHLHALDFIDITKALDANPLLCTKIAQKYTADPYRNSIAHYEAIKEKVQKFVDAKQLGPFANGYWGHLDYKLSEEESLILFSHYLDALKFQTDISKAIAIFAGKTPHPQNLIVGGVTSVADMINPSRINEFIFILKEAKEFIDRAYLPDLKLLVSSYRQEIKDGVGRSNGNFLAVGSYALNDEQNLFSGGIIYDHNFSTVHPFDESKITEEVEKAWYDDANPYYTDLNDDGTLKTEEKYSWIKAPRYDGFAMECGPLARVLIASATNHPHFKPIIDTFLKETNLELIDLSTTIGRNVARAIESSYISNYIFGFINKMLENIKYYDTETFKKYNFEDLPQSAKGRSFFEVPRGVLAHFIQIEEAKIKNYQVIAPTTWNATPRDNKGNLGAYEKALIGVRLADPSKPLEVLKVIHSFDPCLACAVHIIDTKGKELSHYRVNPNYITT